MLLAATSVDMKRAFLAALLLRAAAPAYAAQIDVSPLGGSPQLISISGEIGANDFEAFKAKAGLLSGKVAVGLESPGGVLIAALQIGEYVRLKGWSTFVLDECYSACASIWLAGTPRIMAPQAKIGFHAASVNGQEKGRGNALVGAYMNRLGLGYGAIGWATDASPDEIAILTPAKAKELGIDVTVLEPNNKQANAQPVAPPQEITARPVTPRGIAPPAENELRVIRSSVAEKEVSFLVNLMYARIQSNMAQTYSTAYWDSASYFGKIVPKTAIITDKQNYFDRWPNRTYTIKSVSPIKCYGVASNELNECLVSGEVAFEVTNGTKRSAGTATFEYVLRPWPNGSWITDAGLPYAGMRISVENGKVLTRQITDLKGDPNKAMAECRRLHPPNERAGMALAQCLNDVRGAYGLPIECLHRC
jgi:hypothetical protein